MYSPSRTCLFNIFLMSFLLSGGCIRKTDAPVQHKKIVLTDIKTIITKPIDSFPIYYEQCLSKAGLICIDSLDTMLKLDIRYATKKNFMHRNLYKGFAHVYIHPTTVEKLKKALAVLKLIAPGHYLVIWDATRPWIIQKLMWDSSDIETSKKVRFLARPEKFSLHNYGLALDCSIADSNGTLLDMGTVYDFAGREAYNTNEQELIDEGKLSEYQVSNRKLLRAVMYRAGFYGNPYEWWHFSTLKRNQVIGKFCKIVDFKEYEQPFAITDSVR